MPSAANLLHEKMGLGKAVDPPLRVREDWWGFEKNSEQAAYKQGADPYPIPNSQ